MLNIKDIKLDKLELLKIWENHNIITRNIDNIISDFDYMNQNTVFDEDEDLEELSNEKIKFLNAHICGIISAIAPESMFNKNHVTEDGISVKEMEENKKHDDFLNSLL